jgi:PAS domain S-box-containing protein
MKEKYRILLVEDDPGDAELVREYLSDEKKFHIVHTDKLSMALEHLHQETFDIIILDLGLPDSVGLETVNRMKKESLGIPIVVLTGNDDEEIGLNAVKAGAQDFVIKGICAERMLKRIICYAVERHQNESKLHESEAQFRALSEFSPYAILIYHEKKWVYANKTAEKITEYSAEEILQMDVLDFVHPDDLEKVRENMVKRAAGEYIPPYEFYLKSKSGTKKRCFLTGTRVKFKGKMSSLVTVVDITEQHHLKETVERDDKLRSLGVLAAGIAHDFNNLLNGIFGNIELAQASLSSGKDALKFLERALSVFDRTKELTQKLLTFSKGGAPVFDSTDIVETVLDSAKSASKNSSCTIKQNICGEINECRHDKEQIRQVISAIIKNACESMEGNGEILISISSSEQNVRIDISDFGNGIEKENFKKIFDPFFSTKEIGLGLGLSTSHSIINKHKGTISVDSTVGKGSTFTIALPAFSTRDKPEVDCNKLTERKKVLIMDDEYFIQDLFVSHLSEANVITFCASNGDEALEVLAKEKDIDLAIFDLTVPGGKGGREIIDEVKERFPDLLVFATSGYSSDPIISNPQEFGFTGSIPKPFKHDDLCSKLKKYLCCSDILT